MSHKNTLSVNSISSLIEPTTPPTVASSGAKSYLWDSNKLNGNLNLPSFNLDQNQSLSGQFSQFHNRQLSVDSVYLSDREKDRFGGAGAVSNGAFSGVKTPNLVPIAGPPTVNGPGVIAVHSPNPGVTSGPVGSAGAPVSKITGSNTPAVPEHTGKIDKEYLASISKVPLSQLKADILKLLKDQYGCRFLQKKVDESLVASYETRLANFEIIFKEIYPYLYELIIDPFGNYLIQKLVDYCSEANLSLILEILQFNLFQISINQHGTRALQKIIDLLSNSYQLGLLTKGLRHYIIELIKDLNGNHVIQKILNKYPPESCQFIYDAIIADLYVVATHKHGCCVLQKCLNHVNNAQLNGFAATILSFDIFVKLINDQFGNYVLQYLILINLNEINVRVFHNFVAYGITGLCNLKFSSNVIEKFLKNCYNNELRLPKFLALKFDLTYHVLNLDLNKLINDPYGNYVIQTLIDILVHPGVNYMEAGGGVGESLVRLLSPGGTYSNGMEDLLQIQIIKRWFQNCKIVSSFGKRIQLKINVILNGSKGQKAPKKQNQASQTSQHMAYQNAPFDNHRYSAFNQMNANGEFLNADSPAQTRSLSLGNNQHQFPVQQRAFSVPQHQQYQYQQLQQPQPQQFQQQQQQYYAGHPANYVLSGAATPNVPELSSQLNPSSISNLPFSNLHITPSNPSNEFTTSEYYQQYPILSAHDQAQGQYPVANMNYYQM